MKLFTRADAQTTRQTIRYYLAETKKERKSVITTLIFIPLSDIGYSVGMPLLISLIVQEIVQQKFASLPALFITMLITGVGIIATNYIGYLALFTHEERVMTRLTRMVIGKLLAHGNGFFANQKIGSLSGNVTNFVKGYMVVFDRIMMDASPIILSVLLSLFIIAIIAPFALIPAILLTVAIVWQSLRSLGQRAVIRDKRKVLQSHHLGSIADTLTNHALVRMFARSTFEKRRIVSERKSIERLTFEEIAIMQKGSIYRMSTLFVFQTALLITCAYMAYNGWLSVAALVFIVTYIGRLANSMFGINSVIRGLEQAFLDAASLTEILNIPHEITDAPHAKNIIVQHGTITISDVSYQYKESGATTVFNTLNLTIPAGQRVGIVGKSGSGKTTLTNILLRNMDPDTGTIAIDGQNIATVTQDSLRESIAYVPQDPVMFHRSLRENIAYGKLSASNEQIELAAQHANALDFINQTPHGLDTIVGERGVKLSGGQRQRVAIARAFLKDSPILILDEATSALDSESEHLIQQSLETLMRGRTSIVVAHRLSTISKLDRIIVLEKGRIVEDGSHEELIANNGLYSKLWKRQSGGFIEGE